ncbi:MAG TPA: glycoside hydrolase family 18 protein, partial [Candidatus Limnocylindrales bacterium]|nr:glycoside hydrolase family 18 protein [Candidatus Limnocylindrales bacterium]
EATGPGAADAIFIMGYDYRGASSSPVGSIAPLAGSRYDITETVNAYLARVPASKLILGVPYYGRAWSTDSDSLNARNISGATYGASSAVVYATGMEFLAKNGRRYDALEHVAWTSYSTSTCVRPACYRQLYLDDLEALGRKYDLVNRLGLRGTGMWALGYDGTRPELYRLLRTKFLDGTSYTPLTPARLLDTRIGVGLSGPFSGGVPRVLQVAGRGGVPADAVAVTVNLTVVGQTAGGYVSLTPTPTATPSTSTLNVPLRDIRANGVTVPLGPGGTLAATWMPTPGTSTHLVLDVTGYFR